MNSKDKSVKDKPKALRNVLYLGLVGFFTDFSTGMILGLLPTFVVNNLRVSKAILGAIERPVGFESTGNWQSYGYVF